MSSGPPVENEFGESSVNIQFFLVVMLAMITGLLLAILLLPTWLPNMASSLGGESPKVYWYLSRATAFVSLTILWLSMALGIGISNKMARLWPGAPAAFAIHEYVSLLGMAFAIFHALVLMGDHYIKFTVVQILVPFSTVDYRPIWVGIGQIGFYVWLIINLSFYVRASIGPKTWRALHYLSFGMYITGLLHGLFSGTDTPASWAQWYYWISGGSLLFLLVYRILNAIAEKSARHSKPKPAPQVQRSTPAASLQTRASMPAVTPQTTNKNSELAPVDAKIQPRTSEVPVTENQSLLSENSTSGDSASSVSEVKETTQAPAPGPDKTSSETKINVNIFKEPPSKPALPESKENTETKRIHGETLVVRLKKDFHATPAQPTLPNRQPPRIVILEE
jgi:hypothetical protein